MIEELVSRVFGTRNAVHLAHWATKSYAEHMALGSFYDDLIDGVDAIIEAHQGAFGLIGDVKMIEVPRDNIAEHLAGEAKWIEAAREKLSGGSKAIEARIDDFVQTYLTTVYKLANLDGAGKDKMAARWYSKEKD